VKFHVRSPDSGGGAAGVRRRHHRRRHRRFHVRPEALGLGNYRSDEPGEVDPEAESISWGSLGRMVLYILIALLAVDIVIRFLGHF